MFSTGFAKMEQWTDTKGNAFKAEPAEVIGPLALFRLPNRSGRLLPFRMLSPADCVRFSQQVQALPVPAADWSQTKTAIGSEIYGSALRVQGSKLVEAQLKGHPEPRFYILFYADNSQGKSWDMLGKTSSPFQELQRSHPGMVEGLMFGVKHSGLEHVKMATQMNVPYLVARYDDESKMEKIGRLFPSFGFGVSICNTAGVPLFPPVRGDTDEGAKKIMADLAGILDLLKPSNPTAWADRLYYWKAVQPALHAADKCEPLLIGDPLNPEKLAELSVKRFEATLFVSAAGAVTGVSMAPGADLPEELVEGITQALQNAQLVPAVDGGKFVAGRYRYRFGAD
jgi:hypothetical protein